MLPKKGKLLSVVRVSRTGIAFFEDSSKFLYFMPLLYKGMPLIVFVFRNSVLRGPFGYMLCDRFSTKILFTESSFLQCLSMLFGKELSVVIF